jgi:prephenate dehydrogenase
MQWKRVAIFGVGLLGGSIGLALRAKFAGECRIVGYGHRKATLEQARDIGAVDEVTQDAKQAAEGADLLILCTPVGIFDELLGQIAPALADGAIVTDVGSTKRSVVKSAQKHLQRSPGHFVGSHPMAGSEKRGVEFARTDLFAGARCIVTPGPETNAKALAAMESFWAMLGMNVVRLSPEEHDRLVCDISHLPHALAAALVAMQSDDALQLAGKGFLDTTRVAGGDAGLWRDILQDNRDNAADSIKRLRAQLDTLLALLDPSKKEELAAWLAAAADRRAKLHAQKLKELGG